VELTKTKESLDRCEEEMSHIRSELERVTEAKQKLAMQHKNSEMELNKLQTVRAINIHLILVYVMYIHTAFTYLLYTYTLILTVRTHTHTL